MKTKAELEADQKLMAAFEALCMREPFITAHEASELFDITPQKASALLRKMENDPNEPIAAKRIKAGRGEVKCYYLQRKEYTVDVDNCELPGEDD